MNNSCNCDLEVLAFISSFSFVAVHVCMLICFSHVRLFDPMDYIACQAPLSMWFSRQEYWSELPCPSPGDLPNPEIQPMSSVSPVVTGRFFTRRAIREARSSYTLTLIFLGTSWHSFIQQIFPGLKHHWLNGHKLEQTPGRQWRTGKPGVLKSMRSQRVRHDWMTEQQQQ